MAKKVDVSFMKMVNSEAEWTKEVKEAGTNVLCSAHRRRERSSVSRQMRASLHACASRRSRRRVLRAVGCVRYDRRPLQQPLLRLWRDARHEVCACVRQQSEIARRLQGSLTIELSLLHRTPPHARAVHHPACAEPSFVRHAAVQGGEQVHYIEGSNIPAIITTIKEKAPKLSG